MERKNMIVRDALEKNELPLRYLKNILRCSESSITRMMRDELSVEEQKHIVTLIEDACRNGLA